MDSGFKLAVGFAALSLVTYIALNRGVANMTQLKNLNFKNYNTFDPILKEAAALYNIPYARLKAIVAVESGFNPDAKNPGSSATGLMQLTRAAADQVRADHANMRDPRANIMAGAAYMAWIRRHYFTDIDLATQSYYAGAGAVTRDRSKGVAYLQRVLQYEYSIRQKEGL
jgi:soluble lytic murein transglycosylase-like protein